MVVVPVVGVLVVRVVRILVVLFPSRAKAKRAHVAAKLIQEELTVLLQGRPVLIVLPPQRTVTVDISAHEHGRNGATAVPVLLLDIRVNIHLPVVDGR